MKQPSHGASEAKTEEEKQAHSTQLDVYAYQIAPGRDAPRSFYESERWTWRKSRQLATLTPLQLREYLTKDLRDLEPEESSRQDFQKALRSPPQEDTFWQTLEAVDTNYRLEEETLSHLDHKIGSPI